MSKYWIHLRLFAAYRDTVAYLVFSLTKAQLFHNKQCSPSNSPSSDMRWQYSRWPSTRCYRLLNFRQSFAFVTDNKWYFQSLAASRRCFRDCCTSSLDNFCFVTLQQSLGLFRSTLWPFRNHRAFYEHIPGCSKLSVNELMNVAVSPD